VALTGSGTLLNVYLNCMPFVHWEGGEH